MGFLDRLKKQKNDSLESAEENSRIKRISVVSMEECYRNDNLVEAAIILRKLLEIYGEKKRKNHRLKGREFIHFILNNKHKDLKNVGYAHWKNIEKIIHTNHSKAYPYHKKNLRNTIDFFTKEVKSIKQIDVSMEL
jgi:hypothetical protein